MKFRKVNRSITESHRPPKPSKAADKQTYQVQGKKASELEYLFSVALARANIEYIYDWQVYSPFQLPGQENQIDFILVEDRRPIEIDGEIAHKGSQQREEDKARDQMIDEILRPQGFQPIERIPGNKVDTIEKAQRWVRSNT